MGIRTVISNSHVILPLNILTNQTILQSLNLISFDQRHNYQSELLDHPKNISETVLSMK